MPHVFRLRWPSRYIRPPISPSTVMSSSAGLAHPLGSLGAEQQVIETYRAASAVIDGAGHRSSLPPAAPDRRCVVPVEAGRCL